MGDLPLSRQYPLFHGALISTGEGSAAGEAQIVGGYSVSAAAWPAATRALYMPVTVNTTVTVYKMAWINGVTVGGNVDVGIYDSTGAWIVSSGATATSGASAIQVADITDTTLTPGNYFLAMAESTNTDTFQRANITNTLLGACGVRQTANATLPTTSVTLTTIPTSSYCPLLAAITAGATF